MNLRPESIDHFRHIEHELSLCEAAIGQLMANEPFPEYPGTDADEREVRAWLSAHDVRTERLDELVLRRGGLLDDLRNLLEE